MKTALTLLTCNKPELVEQSIKPLLEAAREQHFHLYVADGSTSEENEKAIWELAYPTATIRSNVRGGAGAAIVYALTEMLNSEENYTHVGLTESDVVLRDNWLGCLDLFSRGEADGLAVGAVSARCYVDRVLFQREHYAVMHNLGAGFVVFTRAAAQLVLDSFRTGFTTDNRRIFCQLANVDLAPFWAFRQNEHPLTADWHWDATLAAHGYASLALTPSPCEMIGQDPPLAEQGLEIAAGPVESRRNNSDFSRYATRLNKVRNKEFQHGVETKFFYDASTSLWTYFPHQMHMLGASYEGDWKLKEVRGWGTFGWEAGENRIDDNTDPEGALSSNIDIPAFGSIAVLFSGGKFGGKVEIVDEQSGYRATPELPKESGLLQLVVPGGVSYRNIQVTALTPGVVFYGIQSREKQPSLPNETFDYSRLPLP